MKRYEILHQRGLASRIDHFAIYDNKKDEFVGDNFGNIDHFNSNLDAKKFIVEELGGQEFVRAYSKKIRIVRSHVRRRRRR